MRWFWWWGEAGWIFAHLNERYLAGSTCSDICLHRQPLMEQGIKPLPSPGETTGEKIKHKQEKHLETMYKRNRKWICYSYISYDHSPLLVSNVCRHVDFLNLQNTNLAWWRLGWLRECPEWGRGGVWIAFPRLCPTPQNLGLPKNQRHGGNTTGG